MLLGSESDLREFNEPIAIPIYGRGRTYFALVGNGINPEMIEENCRFLIGACSVPSEAGKPRRRHADGGRLGEPGRWHGHARNRAAGVDRNWRSGCGGGREPFAPAAAETEPDVSVAAAPERRAGCPDDGNRLNYFIVSRRGGIIGAGLGL